MKKITKVNNFKILEDLGLSFIYLKDSFGKTYILNEKGSKSYKKELKKTDNCLMQTWSADFTGQIYRPKLSGDTLTILQHGINGKIVEIGDEVEITLASNVYDRLKLDLTLTDNSLHGKYITDDDVVCLRHCGHANAEIIADYFAFRNYLNMDTYTTNQIITKWPKLFAIENIKTNFIEWFAAMAMALAKARMSSGRIDDSLCNLKNVKKLDDVYTDMKMPPYTKEIFKSLHMDQIAGNTIKNPDNHNYYYRNYECESIFAALENLHKLSLMDYRYFEIITTSIENNLVSVSNLSETILKMIDNLDHTFEDNETFIQYIKYNNYRPLENVCEEYLEVLKYNKSRGLNPANPTQFSYELSLIKLVDAGFDQQVVDCFAEFMDVDINKALSLIQEKKLSKKKKQTILKTVADEFMR